MLLVSVFFLCGRNGRSTFKCGTRAATLGVNLYIGEGVQAFLGVGEVVLTYLVLRQQWNLFD